MSWVLVASYLWAGLSVFTSEKRHLEWRKVGWGEYLLVFAVSLVLWPLMPMFEIIRIND